MSKKLISGLVLGGSVLLLLIAGLPPLLMVVVTYVGHLESFAAIFLSLLLSGVTFLWATNRGLRPKVICLLTLYLSIVVAFGAIYHSLFLWRPELFAFSPSIEEGQALQEFDKHYKRLLVLNRKLFALALVQGDIRRSSAALATKIGFGDPGPTELDPEKGFIAVTEECKLRLRHDLAGYHGAGTVSMDLLEIRYRNDLLVFGNDNWFDEETRIVRRLFLASDLSDFQSSIDDLIRVVSLRRKQTTDRLRSLVSARPEWGLVDFIYFSAVTVTTVGYGDIVPNSTLVRGVALANSVVGVFFMAFALVFLWPDHQQVGRPGE